MIYTPREEGQGLAEYALILVLVVIVLVVLVTVFGGQVSTLYSRIVNEYPTVS